VPVELAFGLRQRVFLQKVVKLREKHEKRYFLEASLAVPE
jgi:hypothetical protein